MKTIKQIIREETDDFDWVRDIEPSQEDIIVFIYNNPDETVWRFGKHWEGDLDLGGSNIKSLGELETVNGSVYLDSSALEDLGNLKEVRGYLSIERTKVEDLGQLELVMRLYLRGTPLSRTYSKSEILKQHPNLTIGVTNGIVM